MAVQKTSDQKQDYRTNRADHLIAKMARLKTEPRPAERPAQPDERRPARENPAQKLARPRPHR